MAKKKPKSSSHPGDRMPLAMGHASAPAFRLDDASLAAIRESPAELAPLLLRCFVGEEATVSLTNTLPQQQHHGKEPSPKRRPEQPFTLAQQQRSIKALSDALHRLDAEERAGEKDTSLSSHSSSTSSSSSSLHCGLEQTRIDT